MNALRTAAPLAGIVLLTVGALLFAAFAEGYAPFILAAYAASVVVIGALIAWVVVDFRAQKRVLGDLEAHGVTRRSAAIKEPA